MIRALESALVDPLMVAFVSTPIKSGKGAGLLRDHSLSSGSKLNAVVVGARSGVPTLTLRCESSPNERSVRLASRTGMVP